MVEHAADLAIKTAKSPEHRMLVKLRVRSIYEPGEQSGAWIKLRTNMEPESLLTGIHPRRARLRCTWGQELV
jgi:hypothetical protein